MSTDTPFIPQSSQEQPPDPMALRGVFQNPAFVRLWSAQVLSSLGDWVGLFAILAITARVSNNSATAVSLVMVARMLPSFFLATLGGVIVDRFDRRKVMMFADFGRAALLCVLPFANSLWVLVAVSFSLEIFTLLWGPAKDAALPSVVPKEQLANANSLGLVASYGTFPFGGVIFSALAVIATWLGGFEVLKSLAVGKETIALWVDACTFIASAFLIFKLPIPAPTHSGLKFEWNQSIREIREGMEFVRSDRRARAVIVGLGLGIIGAGAMVPLGPVYADVVLGGPAQFGVLMTALGTGAAIGVVTLLMVQRRVRREPVFEMGVIGVGVFLLAAATFSSGGLVALMVAGLGACAGAAYVTGFTILQEHVSDELRGRTFATLAAVVRLCLLLALTVSPLLADVADWLARLLIPNQEISVGALNYVFPGVRFALWIGGLLVIVGGLYARLELTRLGREEASQIHPTRPTSRSLWSPPPDVSSPNADSSNDSGVSGLGSTSEGVAEVAKDESASEDKGSTQ